MRTSTGLLVLALCLRHVSRPAAPAPSPPSADTAAADREHASAGSPTRSPKPSRSRRSICSLRRRHGRRRLPLQQRRPARVPAARRPSAARPASEQHLGLDRPARPATSTSCSASTTAPPSSTSPIPESAGLPRQAADPRRHRQLTWRDIKIYQNHAYIVCDADGGHGMQVFDLTQLRNVASPPATFTETRATTARSATPTPSRSTKRPATPTSSGGRHRRHRHRLGGLHMVDIQIPRARSSSPATTPTATSTRTSASSTTVPTPTYTGHEICFAARGSAHNSTSSTSPTRRRRCGSTPALQRQRLHPPGLVHRGPALHPAQRRARRTERRPHRRAPTSSTRTISTTWCSPALNGYFDHATPAIDHNLYVARQLRLQSNYTGRPAHPARSTDLAQAQLTEVGYFDLYPASNAANFNGTWNNYPFFASGNIAGDPHRAGAVRPAADESLQRAGAPAGLAADANGDHRIDLDWTGSGDAGQHLHGRARAGRLRRHLRDDRRRDSTAPAYDDLAASGHGDLRLSRPRAGRDRLLRLR